MEHSEKAVTIDEYLSNLEYISRLTKLGKAPLLSITLKSSFQKVGEFFKFY